MFFRFPENSRELAKNFCRNPKAYSIGPVCFVSDHQLSSCNISYCGMYGCVMKHIEISSCRHFPFQTKLVPSKRSNATN